MNFAITHRLLGSTTDQERVLPSEGPGLKGRERRALRRAERAHGMDRATRARTNELLATIDLPTARRPV